MVCDPPSMILDSKEYLSPIITPYEAQMAFTNSFVGMNEYQYSMKEEVRQVEDIKMKLLHTWLDEINPVFFHME